LKSKVDFENENTKQSMNIRDGGRVMNKNRL